MALSSTAVPSRPGTQGTVRRALPVPGSLWWLVIAAAAYSGAQLAFVSPHMGLSWDEVVYVSQFSGHAPAAYFDPARARGITLLVAPVALATSSIAALRVYLSLVSGLGLFLALLVWRRTRPAWVLALAAVMFGGLWVAQYYGPQAMPDEWVAFAVLASTGLFLAAAGGDRAGPPPRGALIGLAGCVGLAALLRPLDAVFITIALVGAALAVRSWRRWQLIAATLTGLAAGGAQWVIEAYVRFGGPLARLHAAGAEQGGLGLHLGLWAELRAVNGPTLCRPCTVGWRQPELSLWWLALPVLVTLGVLAARRAGLLRSSLLAALAGLAVAAPYLFGVDYAAPRFLLPAYGLLAIPVADGIRWLVTRVRPDRRRASVAVVAVVLLGQLAVQHVVLAHEVSGTVAFHDQYARIAADLRRLGVRPPCLVKGIQQIPIAFYTGCASAPGLASVPGHGTGRERVAVLGYSASPVPPAIARGWLRYDLTGTGQLRLAAYLPRR